MTDEFARRTADHRASEIERMITMENDSDKRSHLIILNSINNSLIANTETVRVLNERMEAHLEKFDLHAKTEEALLNRGKGMWTVIAALLFVAQAVAGWGFMSLSTNLDDLHKAISKGQDADMKIEARQVQIEAALARIEKGQK